MILNPEKALIGALMIDPQAVKDCGSLQPEMFMDGLLGRIYLQYLRAYDFRYPANLVTIAENMPDIPKPQLLDCLKKCSDSSVVSTAAGKYADAIAEAYKAREATRLINGVNFQPMEIERQIGELVNDLDALRGGPRTSVRNLAQIVDDVSSRYFTDSESPRLYTGFPRLDECLGGLEDGDVIVVGARPAVGKSAFVTKILMSIGAAGKRVLLYNLEMSERQVYERMVSRQSGIKLNRIRRGKSFLGDEKGRFDTANGELKRLDVWISSGAKSVSEIRNECRNMDADCIIIDYLQLVRSDRRYSNRASEVGDISKSIKALAMELKCPVIVLSQLNRVSEGRETREPTMSELRESGDIEQDASVILLLWNRNESDRSLKGLKVEKNRQGQQAKIQLEFVGGSMSFRELEYTEELKGDFMPGRQQDTPFGSWYG